LCQEVPFDGSYPVQCTVFFMNSFAGEEFSGVFQVGHCLLS
jgi:hypothetical protein